MAVEGAQGEAEQQELTAAGRKRASSGEILTIMTTEHYNLQGASAATISESNGRASLFLSTVSGTLLALSFVGQSVHGGEFTVFALILFPSLFFLGLVTFVRALDTAVANILYLRGINRIRHYYSEVAPEIAPYFVLSTHDDGDGVMHSFGASGTSNWLGTWMTTASMVAVIDSVILGVFVGLLLRTVLGLDFGWVTAAGIAAFLLSVAAFTLYQTRHWLGAEARLTTIFPSQGEADSPQQLG